ncbi:hypothetical protein [Mesorhizobium sp. M1143]|uniref:hypothetical protein n=1 Tax=Mesorhizobium sp. M1143 TaxID=2957061 RepID=UPI0033350A91
MHDDDRAGDQDGKQQHRDPGGLAVKEKIRQRHEQDGDAEAAGKACKRCHARIFLMGWVRSAGGRIKGSRLASRQRPASVRGGSTSHQLSLRRR